MKRLLSYVVLVVGLTIPAFASAQQTIQDQSVEFGVMGGASLTDATADADSYADASTSEVGFTAGVQSNWNFSDFLSLHPELQFASRGWETRGTVLDQDVNTDYQFSYFELPVLLRASSYVSENVELKLMAGPHAALFIDGNRTGSADPIIGGNEGEFDLNNENVNDFQFGATGAIGANFEIGPVELTSDVRYQQNITNVFDTTGPDEIQNEDNSVMHHSWQLTLGFLF